MPKATAPKGAMPAFVKKMMPAAKAPALPMPKVKKGK